MRDLKANDGGQFLSILNQKLYESYHLESGTSKRLREAQEKNLRIYTHYWGQCQ